MATELTEALLCIAAIPSQLKPLLVGVNLADPLRCLVTVEGVRVISLQRERESIISCGSPVQ